MTKQQIFQLIVTHTKEVIPDLKDRQFTSSDSLRELGANSIDRSEIIIMTLESLSLNIPLIELAGATNIGDLASIIHAKSGD